MWMAGSLPCKSKWPIQNETTLFLVQLIVVGDGVEDIVAPPYAMVLENFVDAFQPLPSRLPPKHEMAHTIALELDGILPSRLIYRLKSLSCRKLRYKSKNIWQMYRLSPIHRIMSLPYYLSRKKAEHYKWWSNFIVH
jgi:hypothetical protein